MLEATRTYGGGKVVDWDLVGENSGKDTTGET